MGVKIVELLEPRPIKLEDLSGKVIAVDASNHLYQFLTTIRASDGTPFTDSKGRVTSHLMGLFSRNAKLLQLGIRPIWVFDGKPPAQKIRESKRRKELKLKAAELLKEATKKEDVAEMKKYAARTATLTRDMVEEAKVLVKAMGLPIVQAPSEGEAQAAQLVKESKAYAVASQDADSLLFGANLLLRNLSIAGRRKRTSRLSYETVSPEVISLHTTLQKLDINQKQLIALGVLIGTDYNIGGIKGIGAKKALSIVKEQGDNLENIFKKAGWSEESGDWKEIMGLFENMDVIKNAKLEQDELDKDKITQYLCNERDFSQERVSKTLEDLEKSAQGKQQKGLGEFF